MQPYYHRKLCIGVGYRGIKRRLWTVQDKLEPCSIQLFCRKKSKCSLLDACEDGMSTCHNEEK